MALIGILSRVWILTWSDDLKQAITDIEEWKNFFSILDYIREPSQVMQIF